MPVEVTPTGFLGSGKAGNFLSGVDFVFQQDQARLTIDKAAYTTLFVALVAEKALKRFETEWAEHQKNPAQSSGSGWLRTKLWDGGKPDHRMRGEQIAILRKNITTQGDGRVTINLPVVVDLLAEHLPGDFLKRAGNEAAATLGELYYKQPG